MLGDELENFYKQNNTHKEHIEKTDQLHKKLNQYRMKYGEDHTDPNAIEESTLGPEGKSQHDKDI